MDPAQPSPSSLQPNIKKDYFKVVMVAVSVVVLVVIGALSFFFIQKNNALSSKVEEKIKELDGQKTKIGDLEKELIFYKTGDLAKELEIVNLKLQKSDESLQTTKNTLSKTESELSTFRSDISKIPQIANILSLMSGTASKPPPQCYGESDKQKIDSELKSLGDKTWQDLWKVFIDNTTSDNCSFTPDLLNKALGYGYDKITEAAK